VQSGPPSRRLRAPRLPIEIWASHFGWGEAPEVRVRQASRAWIGRRPPHLRPTSRVHAASARVEVSRARRDVDTTRPRLSPRSRRDRAHRPRGRAASGCRVGGSRCGRGDDPGYVCLTQWPRTATAATSSATSACARVLEAGYELGHRAVVTGGDAVDRLVVPERWNGLAEPHRDVGRADHSREAFHER
jgi:hypothetical protein